MAKRPHRRWLLWIPLVLVAATVVAFATGGLSLGGEEGVSLRGQEVQRGPLRITVLERGNLQPADSVVLKSEVEGRTTILFLIEEGNYVEEGTLLCELDTASLHEQRVSQEIAVQNRDAAHVKAKQNYAIQESENESDISGAERQLRFARLDRTKYLEGDYPMELQGNDEEILLAEEELQRAAQDLEWSERLAEKGFLEATQLDADRLSKNRAEIQLKQKQRGLDLLKAYEHPRKLEELDADVEEAERELVRVRLRAEARIVDYEAEVRTTKAQLDLEKEKLAKIDAQIAKAKIYAPRAGMVVYWQEQNRWGNDDPLQEGSEVRERQELITLPSAGKMVAQASLHESVLEKVRIGMPCLVTVDAVPGVTFPGRVRFKAVLPDQVSRWVNPDLRVYRTEIELDSTDERLRPGMSCSVEIVVAQIENALYIPLQAVFLDGGATVAFIEKGDGWELRPIEAGQNDGKWVEVLSGLSQGEVVLLSEPPNAGLRREVMESEQQPAETPDGLPGAVPGSGERPAAPAGAERADRDGGAPPRGTQGMGAGGRGERSPQGGAKRPAGAGGSQGAGGSVGESAKKTENERSSR